MRTLLFLLCLTGSCLAADILAVLPVFAKSHHYVFQPILNSLADRGHKITYITAVPLKKQHKNINEIFVKPQVKPSSNDMKNLFDLPLVVFLREFGTQFLNTTFSDSRVTDIIKSDNLNFDLIILETTFCMEPLIAFSHKFNAPVVEIVSSGNFLWTYWLHGNPWDTSYIVDVGMDFTDKMTFVQRLKNTANFMMMRMIWMLYYVPKFQVIMDENMVYPGWESRPPMMEMIRNNITLVLDNTHLSLRPPIPRSPNFKDIAGINLVPPSPLPKDLQKFMDEATDGVVYFTMGSHLPASTLFGETIKGELVKAFSKLKQKVLWKWETDIPEASPNVKVGQWFPQQDIFAHKNMKVFISHAGFLSQTEAVKNGIPIIAIPIMGDQPLNAKIMEESGYGIRLEKSNVSDASISWALNEVIANERYKETAMKYSKILSDQPQTPLETATYWIDYVIRHKGAHHLTPSVVQLPWWQEALLDVYLTLAIIVFVPIYVTYRIIRCCLCRICQKFCCKTKKVYSKKDSTIKKKKQ